MRGISCGFQFLVLLQVSWPIPSILGYSFMLPTGFFAIRKGSLCFRASNRRSFSKLCKRESGKSVVLTERVRSRGSIMGKTMKLYSFNEEGILFRNYSSVRHSILALSLGRSKDH